MKKILTALALSACVAAPASAVSYSFNCITNTNATNCAIGAAQLRVDVTGNASQALFQFYNTGSGASGIADVYFDDGTLLSIATINNSTGVNFSQFANPSNLPGANNADPDFVTTAGFSADSDSPVSKNAVNPGETLGILFDLQPGKSFADVINAFSLGGAPGGLRVGLHVQSFSNGGSESFITSAVPEVSKWLMMLVGISFIATRAMRR